MGVCKPNLVKCFGPRLRLWTWTLDFVPGPSFSKSIGKLTLVVGSGQECRVDTDNSSRLLSCCISSDTENPVLFLCMQMCKDDI